MPGERRIFVFGSNRAGRHNKGAALFAKQNHGAVHGVGEGRTGNAYAVPTKNAKLWPLSIEEVAAGVEGFINYAYSHPELKFEVTRVGCGYARFSDQEIGPMFQNAPPNCRLPKGWRTHFCTSAFQFEETLPGETDAM